MCKYFDMFYYLSRFIMYQEGGVEEGGGEGGEDEGARESARWSDNWNVDHPIWFLGQKHKYQVHH